MNKYLLPEWWAAQWETIKFWVETELLVWSSAVQLAVILAAFGLAKLISIPVKKWLTSKTENFDIDFRLRGIYRALRAVITPFTWLALVWVVGLIADASGYPTSFLRVAESLLFVWVVIRLAAQLIRNIPLRRIVTIGAWTVAALNIVGLLDPALELLDDIALTLGSTKISLLVVLKALIALAVLLWLALFISRLGERSIRSSGSFTPSIEVLLSKLLKIVLVAIAFVLALNIVGVDLTALTVFGGALGVGLGFGMQKIVANFISGIILLMDKSIKPGDVIAVDDTFGWINHLGIRYTSVITRDGTEHLIPNELLITEKVENWSHSDHKVRFKIPVGVSYNTDVYKARELCIEAANKAERILDTPPPVCHIVEFGDNSVNLEVRVWIQDPIKGVTNILSEVRLNIWDMFHEHDIEIPFPQRDLHLRTVESDAAKQLAGNGAPIEAMNERSAPAAGARTDGKPG